MYSQEEILRFQEEMAARRRFFRPVHDVHKPTKEQTAAFELQAIEKAYHQQRLQENIGKIMRVKLPKATLKLVARKRTGATSFKSLMRYGDLHTPFTQPKL